MTSANKEQVGRLYKHYDIKPETKPSYSCFDYALAATMEIYISTFGESLPSIWSVNTEENSHAYLELDGVVYNEGVTWPDSTYPNYDFPTLQLVGNDVTLQLLVRAWEEYSEFPLAERLSPINLGGDRVLRELRYSKTIVLNMTESAILKANERTE